MPISMKVAFTRLVLCAALIVTSPGAGAAELETGTEISESGTEVSELGTGISESGTAPWKMCSGIHGRTVGTVTRMGMPSPDVNSSCSAASLSKRAAKKYGDLLL